MDPKHVIMLAGQYDRIAPPEEIEELSRLWGGTHFACFPQGHVGYTLMPESFRLAQEIWPERFWAGTRFSSPPGLLHLPRRPPRWRNMTACAAACRTGLRLTFAPVIG